MSVHKIANNEKGIALIVVLILITILTTIGLAANRNVVTDILISSNHLSSVKAFYAADGGAQYGFNQLWQELKKQAPNVGAIMPPAMSGYTFSMPYIGAVGGITTKTVTGNYSGLTAFVQKYRITSTANETWYNGTSTVIVEAEDQLIPIFQFGIFYNDTLEIGPGSDMTFTGGRIHSNSDAYLSAYSGKTLSIDSAVTSGGGIHYGVIDGRTTQTGTVRIKDAAGTYQTLDNSNDSDTANWATDSQSRWGGKVKDSATGIFSIDMPISSGGEPIDMLGQGSGSLYEKSGLRIINGVAKNKDGNIVDLTYYDANYKNPDGSLKIDPGATASKNVNPISASSSNPTFYDGREQKTMTAVEVDLSKLQNSATAIAALNAPPTGEKPGILYVSSNNITNPSVRLINGSALDSTKLPQGLSVGTNNPLYIKGNYNTSNRPAAIFADAITVLSGNWNDANSSSSLDSRVAAATTVNAAFMAGNKNTSGTDYSGGVENFIRLLEKWTNIDLTYVGSIVCMWQSQQSTRKWPGTGSVYAAPRRIWSYSVDFTKLPPGTPSVRFIQKTSWRRLTN